MHITNVLVQNFRALEDIDVNFETRVSVIVGPNAAGKSTVLESIRLARGLISARTPSESAQVLNSLGASSPHAAGRIRFEALARDVGKQLRIRLKFSLSPEDLKVLTSLARELSRSVVQSQIGQPFATQESLLGFMSSTQGKAMSHSATDAVSKVLTNVAKTGHVTIELNVDPSGQASSRANPIEAQIVALLEKRLPPYKTGFMYFPADRALPIGEQAVQLGSADAQQQVESYNSQPQSKFVRLKNTIFAAHLVNFEGEADSATIDQEFEKIFSGVLKGRSLGKLGVNSLGALGVNIVDTDGSRAFDIDAMSSGEKGLILTFLLIARSVVRDGIVLLDEPELHLNPAVCKLLLNFLVEQYVKPRNLQMIICSHSPEILSGAFENEDCSLFHLISSTNISRVSQKNEADLDEAFRRLGASKTDALLYRGLVYVEGIDDIAMLEAGFPTALRRFKLVPSQGRKEVEKAAALLQKEADDSSSLGINYFILDGDGKPVALKQSRSVRILQWERYCLENYLLDEDVIVPLLMDREITSDAFRTSGDALTFIKRTAFKQLDRKAARIVYERDPFDGLGLRQSDLKIANPGELSAVLSGRIENLRLRLMNFDEATWQAEFLRDVTIEKEQLCAQWDDRWIAECSGKQLIADLCEALKIRGGGKQFKLRAIREAGLKKTKSWIEVQQKLVSLLEVAD